MELWVKAAHVIAVISWVAAFLYLPRLMVHHCDAKPGGELSEKLKVMERLLLKSIMTPAMIATWIFGLWTAWLFDVWAQGWFVSKLFLVVILTVMHFIAAKWVKEFAADANTRSQKFYRIANEVPTGLMVLIVILVVVKPF